MLKAGNVCYHPGFYLSKKLRTLPGLTCDPSNKKALEKLYEIKKRHHSKQFVFLVKSLSNALDYWKPLSLNWKKALAKIWPDNLSVIHQLDLNFKTHQGFPAVLDYKNIAFRLPKIPTDYYFYQVLNLFPYPLPTTSINISNTPSLIDPIEIKKFIDDHNIYYHPSEFFNNPNLHQKSSQENLNDHVKYVTSTVIAICSNEQNSFKIIRSGSYNPKKIITMLDGSKIKT